MMRLLLLLAVVAPSAAILGMGRVQSVSVTGKLICEGKPAAGVKIKLYEKDKLYDDLLMETQTDAKGEFHVTGKDTEVTKIDPKVNIYHRCASVNPCYRKFGITIPDKYITDGETPTSTYDIGTYNLEGKQSGEEHDCIN